MSQPEEDDDLQYFCGDAEYCSYYCGDGQCYQRFLALYDRRVARIAEHAAEDNMAQCGEKE